MPRNKTLHFHLLAVLTILLAAPFAAPGAFPQYAPGGAMVKGTVKSSDGKPMEGVTVSVRGEGKTFVTTVFTNAQGAYQLPRLEKGKYKLWAQAVGFEAARVDLDVADGAIQQAAPLQLARLKDFHTQLSANEWMSSLPGSDPKDVRMKHILITECTGCHQIGYPLQNRFDAAGWNTIVTVMSKMQGSGGYVPANPSPYIKQEGEVLLAYKDEIVDYLAKVRGPDSPLTPKLLPRPTGDATGVVITEFDLPRPEQPSSILTHDGSIWSDGIPSRYSARAVHDVAPSYDGNVYFSDDITPDRTIGKVDPRTGKVTSYKLLDQNGKTVTTHGIVSSSASGSLVWMNGGPIGTFVSFDPETEKFHNFARPDGTVGVGGNLAVDSKGNVWATTEDGAAKMDPKTGAYTFYKAVDVLGSVTYGITIDSEDTAWFAEPGIDIVGYVDQAGHVGQVKLPARKGDYFTDKDRELNAKFVSENLKSGGEFAGVLAKGSRRLAADPKGNYVWVADTFGDQIERIDIHTKEVKEYTVPYEWSEPYAVSVDKNHMVWVNLLGSDAVTRFDPNTEKFTDFQLPTRGTESRWIISDNTTDPPTIWIGYNRVNRIARIQFRKAAALASQGQ